MKGHIWIVMAVSLFLCGSPEAKNCTVEGDMQSTISFEILKMVSTGPGVREVTLSFVEPPSFTSATCRQDITGYAIRFTPEPRERSRKIDERGNHLVTAVWTEPPPAIHVRISFDALNVTALNTIDTRASFPLGPLPGEMAPYLKATELVQSDRPLIIQRARDLTDGAVSEFDAVQKILIWIVDHMRYVTPPAQYDALYSAEQGKGNCQNYSHLAAALMRAAGIPVRIVNGITLKKPYDVNREGGVLTFRMGQGRHAWIEVWFPDLGWIPFDPHQSAMFVANRYVRIEVGIDNGETVKDGRVRWTRTQGSRGNVRSSETINADFPADRVVLTGTAENYGPRNLLLCPPVASDFREVVMQEAAPLSVTVKEDAKALVFGNLDLPLNIDFSAPPAPVIVGDGGHCEQRRTFYVETAEYVTSARMQFVQTVVVNRPVRLERIGAALHRFGGSGALWIDLYEDKKGFPGALITASKVIDAGTLSLVPGYRWQDFSFDAETVILTPGRYWIGLGYTGDPIINWFYTYGKPVGPLNGTRYKYAYGGDWSGSLSYEFNYRIEGTALP